MLVFDASALIAWLRREGPGHIVRRLLRAHRGSLFVHAINVIEVFRHFAQYHDEPTADRALGIIAAAGVEVRTDLDPAFRREAGALIAERRRLGRGLALGDAAGLVLARRLGGEFITAEHGEIDPIAAAGVYRVLFVR